MAKTFLSGLLFAVTLFVGITIKKNYKKRLDFFQEYSSFLEDAKNRISAFRSKVGDICNSHQGKYLNDKIYKEEQYPVFIKDSSRIKEFFSSFGKADYSATISLLEKEIVWAKSQAEKASADYKGKGALCEKLCLLGGITLVIIII